VRSGQNVHNYPAKLAGSFWEKKGKILDGKRFKSGYNASLSKE
jgi:hypothetical protein